MYHQDTYQKILHDKIQTMRSSGNVSIALKTIFNDSRGVLPVSGKRRRPQIDDNQNNKYTSTYRRDYTNILPKCHSNYVFERSHSDVEDLLRKRDMTAFRNWRIPDSIISGKFPMITVNAQPYKEENKTNEIDTELEKEHIITIKPVIMKEKKIKNAVEESSIMSLLDNANVTERRVMLKSFFLHDRQILKYSLRQALMPDSEKKIKVWLSRAKPEEKATAVNFFKRLLKNESLTSDDKYFIQHILEFIKSDDDYWLSKPPHPLFSEGQGDPKLKYINLQTPETRRQRWMYTSWNHMPPYKETKSFEYTGSHYCLPGKLQPSTYRIHPDME